MDVGNDAGDARNVELYRNIQAASRTVHIVSFCFTFLF